MAKRLTRANPDYKQEWIRRYAERMIAKAAVEQAFAVQAGGIAWDEMIADESGYDEPEDAADSEMSHWDDDGDDE